MIEAMACGTPVIAFRFGSVPEVIEDGVSGLTVGDTQQAVAAVRHVGELNRLLVRRAFERRFTVEAMTRAYLEIYHGLPGTRTSTFANRSTKWAGAFSGAIGDAISVNSRSQHDRSGGT
jgi:hypothetical protein